MRLKRKLVDWKPNDRGKSTCLREVGKTFYPFSTEGIRKYKQNDSFIVHMAGGFS
jgi:hypothetical protein